jgi:hypothetical protein
MHLLQTYIDHFPEYVLGWKLYGALALCLTLEAVYFVHARPLLSVGLAQDFVFSICKRWLFLPVMLANAAIFRAAYGHLSPPGEWQIARVAGLAAVRRRIRRRRLHGLRDPPDEYKVGISGTSTCTTASRT